MISAKTAIYSLPSFDPLILGFYEEHMKSSPEDVGIGVPSFCLLCSI